MTASDLPSLREATREYLRIGLLSFGGPAAQIALMHKSFVDEKGWIEDRSFLNALSFTMLLPGPEAMQLASYVGWRLHGVVGGLIAGFLFVLPGALIIYALAWIYAIYGTTPLIEAVFLGIKSAVVVIVIEALIRVSKRALHVPWQWGVAFMSFIGIFAFNIPYPLIILLAGMTGLFLAKPERNETYPPPQVPIFSTLRTILIWLTIWFVPIIIVGWIMPDAFLFKIGVFFSKLATVTFGGAYAVLAYMSQEVVFDLDWLSTTQMMDGLGLAETTPGPLILVAEFVGYMAGYAQGGIGSATASALMVLWVTFAPCFLWIFAGAPYIEWISHQPKLKGALAGITAAVVGVILSLSLWFGLHVFFSEIHQRAFGMIKIWQPVLASLDFRVVIIMIISGFLILKQHMNILYVLIICALLGVVLSTL